MPFSAGTLHAAWQDKPVSDDQLHELYDLAKWGPTSMNCLPMRLAFLKSPAAKARLKPMLAEGNVDKVLAAPVTMIVACDRNSSLMGAMHQISYSIWVMGIKPHCIHAGPASSLTKCAPSIKCSAHQEII